MSKPNIHVAIAVLCHRRKVLVGWRNAGQHQGNKHEFPGGKVELGETPEQACRREIFEEVGIGIQDWFAFDHIVHDYDDIVVNLHVFRAFVEDNQLSLIQRPWIWVEHEQLKTLNFPKANTSIIERLVWPPYIKISTNLSDLKQSAINESMLFYWRPESKDIDVIQRQLKNLSQTQFGRLILNIDLWQQLDRHTQQAIATIHLKQHQLSTLHKAQLPLGKRVIAACHDQSALKQAEQLGCDAVFLSPVLETLSHPNSPTLGWDTFSQYAKEMHVLVFALGGMTMSSLALARQHHAYGIAGIRAFQ